MTYFVVQHQAHVKQAALDPECTFHPQTANPEEILAASSRCATRLRGFLSCACSSVGVTLSFF